MLLYISSELFNVSLPHPLLRFATSRVQSFKYTTCGIPSVGSYFKREANSHCKCWEKRHCIINLRCNNTLL